MFRMHNRPDWWMAAAQGLLFLAANNWMQTHHFPLDSMNDGLALLIIGFSLLVLVLAVIACRIARNARDVPSPRRAGLPGVVVFCVWFVLFIGEAALRGYAHVGANTAAAYELVGSLAFFAIAFASDPRPRTGKP